MMFILNSFFSFLFLLFFRVQHNVLFVPIYMTQVHTVKGLLNGPDIHVP